MARAYVGLAVANAVLLDLMFSVKHGPEVSEALGATSHRWSEQLLELIGEGQAASGMLPPEVASTGSTT
ncbi:hypothetical protein ACWD4J_14690 [Streptomyces sp. NPDC002577]